MCTSWNSCPRLPATTVIITYWEMCTSWNHPPYLVLTARIITYWEMCTSWNTSGTLPQVIEL